MRLIVFFVFLFLVVFFSGCTPPPVGEGRFVGAAFDVDTNAGVYSYFSFTNLSTLEESGSWSNDTGGIILTLPEGVYDVNVSAVGYGDVNGTVEITNEQAVTFMAELVPISLAKYISFTANYKGGSSIECTDVALRTFDSEVYFFRNPVSQPGGGYAVGFEDLTPQYYFDFEIPSSLVPVDECMTGDYFDELKCKIMPDKRLEVICKKGVSYLYVFSRGHISGEQALCEMNIEGMCD